MELELEYTSDKYTSDKYTSDDDKLQLIINGIEKEYVDKSSIIDFGWYIKSVASREGIKNFMIKINGEPIEHQNIPKVKVQNIKTLEISTWDWARYR